MKRDKKSSKPITKTVEIQLNQQTKKNSAIKRDQKPYIKCESFSLMPKLAKAGFIVNDNKENNPQQRNQSKISNKARITKSKSHTTLQRNHSRNAVATMEQSKKCRN